MAYTRHGHHIPGTVLDGQPEKRMRCGGPKICGVCSVDAARNTSQPKEPDDICNDQEAETHSVRCPVCFYHYSGVGETYGNLFTRMLKHLYKEHPENWQTFKALFADDDNSIFGGREG